jgi:hypothetical protein
MAALIRSGEGRFELGDELGSEVFHGGRAPVHEAWVRF